MKYKYYYSDELYHHGILGQKWGVRRYQNKDGSLTAKGKKRQTEGKETSTISAKKCKAGDKIKIGNRDFTVTEDKYGKELEWDDGKKSVVVQFNNNDEVDIKKAEKEIKYCESKEFLNKARSQAAEECEMFLRDYKPDKTYKYVMDPKKAADTLDVQFIQITRSGDASVSLWPRDGVEDWLGGHSIDYETGVGKDGKRYFRSGGING